MFSKMKVHCPICCVEMDGMKGYGREAKCCGRECYLEWQWREALAIMGKEYHQMVRDEKIAEESLMS